MRNVALVSALSLLLAGSAGATALDVFESTLGAPGVTAVFPNGSTLIADIDFDADSAEGGGLQLGGPSELTIVPTGSLSLEAFTCQSSGCTENVDYVFTPGGAGVGQLVWSDPVFTAQTGIIDLGLLEFDALAGFGTIELTGCNYTGGDSGEYQCAPFTLVSVPEPGSAALLGFGVLGLAVRSRRQR